MMGKAIGWLMFAAPFVAFFVYTVMDGGWRAALQFWGFMVVVVTWLAVAAYLIHWGV